MPSDAIFELITSGKTVTAAMEKNPTRQIDEVAHEVFPEKPQTATKSTKLRTHDEYTKEDLDRAEQCGKFPYRPSDLFLKVSYLSACTTLDLNSLEDVFGRVGHARAWTSQEYVLACSHGLVRSHSHECYFLVRPRTASHAFQAD